jgi:hypothetical protein
MFDVFDQRLKIVVLLAFSGTRIGATDSPTIKHKENGKDLPN